MRLRTLAAGLLAALLLAGQSPAGSRARVAGSLLAEDRATPAALTPAAAPDRSPAPEVILSTHVYTSTVPLLVPDYSCPSVVTSTLTVTESFPVGNVDVGLWIEHPWRSDLDLALTSPSGTTVRILSFPGGNVANLNVRLDDSSPNSADAIPHVAPPPYYTTWWHPDAALRAFRFEDAQGEWLLTACDDDVGDEGTLRTWTLFLQDGLVLEPTQQDGNGCAGSGVPYELDVINATGLAQDISLTYDSPWASAGPASTGLLSATTEITVGLTLTVPWGAGPLDSADLIITATGQAGQSAQASLTALASMAGGFQDVSQVPEGRLTRDHSLVYFSGKLYKIGGNDGAARDWVDIYSIATGAWSAGASMPAPRSWTDAVVIGNKIYVAGGYNLTARDTLFAYSPSANNWFGGAALPEPRHGYAGVALGGKYYVIGGFSGDSYANTLWAYDPATDSWDTGLAPMAVARRYPIAGAIGGKIVVTGGMSASDVYENSTEVFDPATGVWTQVAPLPAPGWVRAADAVIDDRYLVVAGGFSSDTVASANALAYDAVADRWSWLPDMTHRLYGTEGDGDGAGLWLASGRMYEGQAWSYSPYLIKLLPCPPCQPVSSADFGWQPAQPASGLPVRFAGMAAGSPPIDWSWQFGDGASGLGRTPTHVYGVSGAFSVTLTAANACGQQAVTHDLVVAPGAGIFLPVILHGYP